MMSDSFWEMASQQICVDLQFPPLIFLKVFAITKLWDTASMTKACGELSESPDFIVWACAVVLTTATHRVINKKAHLRFSNDTYSISSK